MTATCGGATFAARESTAKLGDGQSRCRLAKFSSGLEVEEGVERMSDPAEVDSSSTCHHWGLGSSGSPLECVEQPRPGGSVREGQAAELWRAQEATLT